MTQVFQLLLALCTGPAAAKQAGGWCLQDQLVDLHTAAAEAVAEAPAERWQPHGNNLLEAHWRIDFLRYLAQERI
jgi:hypothetical protein